MCVSMLVCLCVYVCMCVLCVSLRISFALILKKYCHSLNGLAVIDLFRRVVNLAKGLRSMGSASSRSLLSQSHRYTWRHEIVFVVSLHCFNLAGNAAAVQWGRGMP